ncbi:MAG: aldo/keto reductase, partial [Polyangia bacterium]
MVARTRTVQGVTVPSFFYGTAWKEERTAALTRLALDAGFLAIDTANQRRHYFEAAVGEAIAASGRARAGLFLQTKFTHTDGQDHRLPYDPAATPPEQVEQSFASSLVHLGTDRIDSY